MSCLRSETMVKELDNWAQIVDYFKYIYIFSKTYLYIFQVDMTTWESAKHNMGMAFTRVLWRKIHGCREYFCNYDDYNWDWSLQHMSKQCFQKKLEVLLVKGPRVFHIGEW